MGGNRGGGGTLMRMGRWENISKRKLTLKLIDWGTIVNST